MSEMSSLSHEYASTSDFSREINEAVLALKRQFVRKGARAPHKDVEQAAHRVKDVLNQLLTRLGEAVPGAEVQAGETLIPEDVIARIESDRRGDRTYFISDVKRLAGALSATSNLDENDLRLLDSICTAADASASATFRKLWRR
jgi:hypothetical protein